MKTKSIIASILFADLKGSSKIKDDTLKQIITEKIENIKGKILNSENHFFYKSMGDGVLICCYDYIDMAEIALNIRDEIKNTNWKRLGFQENLSVRIGVHLSRINVKEENNIILDVFGTGIDLAARIEPIAEENSVYCSRKFYDFLFEQESSHFNAVSLGIIPLAKDFGDFEIFKLYWNHENSIEPETNNFQFHFPQTSMDFAEIPIPRVKMEFTDEQKDAFISNSYSEIKKYFKTALSVLNEKLPDVEVSFIESLDDKFACKIFFKGNLKCKCKIWLRDRFTTFTPLKSICYSENYVDLSNDNKFNQWVTVDYNNEHVFLNISNMGKFNNRIGFTYTEINSKKAAEVLWLSFIQPFE